MYKLLSLTKRDRYLLTITKYANIRKMGYSSCNHL